MAIRMLEHDDDVVSLDHLSTGRPLADHADRVVRLERVAAEAYAIFESRGCEDGHDLEDWLEAERRLLAGIVNDRHMSN